MTTEGQETVDARLARIEAQLAVLLKLVERIGPLIDKAERWGKAKAAKARAWP